MDPLVSPSTLTAAFLVQDLWHFTKQDTVFQQRRLRTQHIPTILWLRTQHIPTILWLRTQHIPTILWLRTQHIPTILGVRLGSPQDHVMASVNHIQTKVSCPFNSRFNLKICPQNRTYFKIYLKEPR